MTAATALDRRAGRAARSPVARIAARVGLASRGAIYCVVAAIAIAVAAHNGHHRGPASHEVDRQGALESLARDQFGRVLLVALAAGFACYAIWRAVKAVTGAGEGSGHEDGARGLAKRAADVGRALIYVGLLVSTVRVLTRRQGSATTNDRAREWTARLMGHSLGRGAVFASGVALVITGVVLVARAVRFKFEKHLEVRRLQPWQRRWFPRLGLFGYAARGVVAVLVGLFLIEAAVRFDPRRAVGVDGALRRLAQQPFGPLWLGVAALGLFAFGCYSFVEAGWRKVLEE